MVSGLPIAIRDSRGCIKIVPHDSDMLDWRQRSTFIVTDDDVEDWKENGLAVLLEYVVEYTAGRSSMTTEAARSFSEASY